MPAKICAIHQPNFFPWLGYFNKIKRCDKFIILDDVQFPKTGSTWLNHVAINIQGQKKWITAPVVRKHGVWSVQETCFLETAWRANIKKTLQMNYAKAGHFSEIRDFIFTLIDFPSNKLLEYNLNALFKIGELLQLGFRNKIEMASSFNANSTATQRLVDIVKASGCAIYLSGGGAGSYQEDDKFASAGIKLVYQDYQPQPYQQVNADNFISGLSMIDVLMNCGIESTSKLLSSR
ncbi:MAG: WbqC family protein [bacterium]|jgi:hypothetical protein|nr:WbqC family protein [bacterium]